MSPKAEQSDRRREPADRWHPHYETFTNWLDAMAPADQCQKLRNRPKWRRSNNNVRVHAPTICVACGETVDGRDIVNHLRAHRGASAC